MAAIPATGGSIGALPGIGGLEKSAGLSGSEKSGASFVDVLKGVAQEAKSASQAADSATTAAIKGELSDSQLTEIMIQADTSLQSFKAVYETTNKSLKEILNMGI